eukprot:3751262-Rhodomonas_salina.1
MSRIRIVWSRIWSILGEHFQSVALTLADNVPCSLSTLCAVPGTEIGYGAARASTFKGIS